MDQNKAWLVDYRIGYRCQALMAVQRKHADEDERAEKQGMKTYPAARKWIATEHIDGSPGYAREDSQG